MSYELVISPQDAGSGSAGGDDAYVAKQLADAVANPKVVYLDTTVRPLVLRQPIRITPAPGETQGQIRAHAIRKGSAWPTFEYLGAKTPAIVSVVGMKGALIDDVLVRSQVEGCAGWFLGTDYGYQSHSGGTYRHLGFVATKPSVAGILVGDDTRKGRGHADMSCCTFERCYVVGAGLVQDGLWEFGGNTCNLLHQGFAGYGFNNAAVRVEGNPAWNPYFNSGGTTFVGTDIGQAKTGFLVAGGAHLSIVGGRSEKISGPVIHTLAGGGPGWVKVHGFFPAGVDIKTPAFAQADGQTVVTIS